jgi:transcriptional regulator with XRE-family HTH domain
MNQIKLGKFIAKLRNDKKLTQEELAEKLYIDKRKISRWECGTSMPEFDMLIKLSEILNVSLYELSICQRIEKEGLTKKIINSFKSIKDYKKYELKNRIIYIIKVLLFILLIITLSYTIIHYNTIGIYKLTSLDNNYYIEGNYIYAKDFNLLYIKKLYINNIDKLLKTNECEYEIYDDKTRLLHVINDNKKEITYYESKYQRNIKNILTFEVTCRNNKKIDNYKFNIELKKIYNNRLF